MRYNDITHRYFATAPRAGRLLDAGARHGERGDKAKGLWVAFDLLVVEGNVTDSAFLALGCPHTIAVSAFLAEQAVGRPLTPGPPQDLQALRTRFAVPTEKLGRLLLIEDAWIAAAHGAALKQL